jgi:hypothetical protein
MRRHICRLAGFTHPHVVAEVAWIELHDMQRELIRQAVRKNVIDLPSAAWGLA